MMLQPRDANEELLIARAERKFIEGRDDELTSDELGAVRDAVKRFKPMNARQRAVLSRWRRALTDD